ncbi:hypothetical protein, partial [Wolbachia endosymbiont of Mansonella ozzardi]|uniref:hypothetical protein n=1 Tax=Wolbachia endosymbiont of Mansonella ozzardi TaxID=137464 RepID=UPI001CE1FB2F
NCWNDEKSHLDDRKRRYCDDIFFVIPVADTSFFHLDSSVTHWDDKKGYLDDIIEVQGIGMTKEGGAYFSRQRSHKISTPYFKSKFLT